MSSSRVTTAASFHSDARASTVFCPSSRRGCPPSRSRRWSAPTWHMPATSPRARSRRRRRRCDARRSTASRPPTAWPSTRCGPGCSARARSRRSRARVARTRSASPRPLRLASPRRADRLLRRGDTLDPLRPPRRRLERLAEVRRDVRDLPVVHLEELHDLPGLAVGIRDLADPGELLTRALDLHEAQRRGEHPLVFTTDDPPHARAELVFRPAGIVLDGRAAVGLAANALARLRVVLDDVVREVLVLEVEIEGRLRLREAL